MFKSASLFISLVSLIGSADLVMAQPRPNLQPHVTPWEAVTPSANAEKVRGTSAPSIPLTPTTWTLIGPQPLNSNGAAGNVSGRITGIAVDPTNASIIYIAAAGGGVWKTINGGTNWVPITDSQQTLSMGAIAIAPNNASVIYAGTGESNNSLDSNFGRGILVSTNGGATWTLRTGPAGVFNNSRLTVARIAVDPTASGTAYAAVADFGNNGTCCAAGTTGIWKTTDTGATWTNVTFAVGLDSTRPWSDVQLDQNAPATIYAAQGEYDGFAGNGVYKSTNSGATWTLLTTFPGGIGVGRIALAVATTNTGGNKTLYVTASNPGSPFGSLLYIRRSDDGGATSTDLTGNPGMGNYMGGQGWYDTVVTVDPANSAIVIVAGASGTSSPGSILRSSDSGANWTNITGGASRPHVDHHAGAFVGGLYLDGDDGGIYRLDNPTGPVWTNLNGDLATIQFQGIGLHPTDPNQALGGSQDNGTEKYTGSLIWSTTDGGDGGFAKFSQTNGNIAYHQIPNGSAGSSFFRFSNDAGASWTTHTTGIAADVNVQQFYAPFVVDPGNGDRVLYGTNGVWETTNQGVAWTKLAALPVAGFVNAIGVAPSTVNTIYVAGRTSSGSGFGPTNVYVTTNHGTTWTTVNTGFPAGATVQDLQVDPTTPTTAYAVLSNFSSGGNVFKTINGGTNWTNISGNLAAVTACACAIPVWSLQIDNTAGKLYIGAEDGVYVSSDSGTTWSRFGAGLPNGQVFQIELNKNLNILGAGIHGRSMWEISTAPLALPDLTISKSHVGSFVQGSTGNNYTVTVTNSGTGDKAAATAVSVTDVPPSGLTVTAMSGPGWTCTTIPTCTRTDVLLAGNSYPAITVTVTVGAAATSPQVNSITVTTAATESNTGNNTVTDSTVISAALLPDLTISKSHVGSFAQGSTGNNYTVTVTNSGTGDKAAATAVSVTDVPPSGLTVTAMSGPGWTCTTIPTCTRTDVLLAGNSYPAITVTVTVGAAATSPQVNSITVTTAATESNTGNNTATDSTVITAALLPDLTITKSHVGSFAQGSTGNNYTVTVTNSGTGDKAAATAVSVTDVPPSGLTVTAMSGTGWTCTTLPTCTRSDVLLAGNSYPAITVTVTVGAAATSPQVNSITVSTAATESNTGNNTATDSTVITAALLPDLTITKSHVGSFVQGSTGNNYTVTVTNSGTGDKAALSSVSVTDAPPSGLTVTAMSGTGWTCTTLPTCTRSDVLLAGNSYPAITVTVTVGAAATSPQVNSITVSTAAAESNTGNNTATDSTVITAALLPDLTITKSHVGSFVQGQVGATYTILVTNSGTGPTTGAVVTVQDTLPVGLTATAMSGSGWTCNVGTVSCTSTAIVAASSPFPAITLTVNVAANAAASLTNAVTVAGGGETNTTNDAASDPTVITAPVTSADAFQVRYAVNLTAGESVINMTNTGANGASLTGPGFGAIGNICVNVYAFSPDEQLVSCCSCLITPNGLATLSVNADLINNTLTGVKPNSVVVKLVNTAAGPNFTANNCANSAATAGGPNFPLAGGMRAYGTTIHIAPVAGTFGVTETPFIPATLSPAELVSITNRCTNIVGNGSGFGICRSCRAGGSGSVQ